MKKFINFLKLTGKNFTLAKIFVAFFIIIPVLALVKLKLYGGLYTPCDYNGYLIIGSIGWILNNFFTPIVSEILGVYNISIYRIFFGNKITLGSTDPNINTWKPNILHMNIDENKEKLPETNTGEGKRKRSDSPIEVDKKKRTESPILDKSDSNPQSPSPFDEPKDFDPDADPDKKPHEYSTKIEANTDPAKAKWKLSYRLNDGTPTTEYVTGAEIGWRLFVHGHVPGFNRAYFAYGPSIHPEYWNLLTHEQKIRAAEEKGYLPLEFQREYNKHLERQQEKQTERQEDK